MRGKCSFFSLILLALAGLWFDLQQPICPIRSFGYISRHEPAQSSLSLSTIEQAKRTKHNLELHKSNWWHDSRCLIDGGLALRRIKMNVVAHWFGRVLSSSALNLLALCWPLKLHVRNMNKGRSDKGKNNSPTLTSKTNRFLCSRQNLKRIE